MAYSVQPRGTFKNNERESMMKAQRRSVHKAQLGCALPAACPGPPTNDTPHQVAMMTLEDYDRQALSFLENRGLDRGRRGVEDTRSLATDLDHLPSQQ